MTCPPLSSAPRRVGDRAVPGAAVLVHIRARHVIPSSREANLLPSRTCFPEMFAMLTISAIPEHHREDD